MLLFLNDIAGSEILVILVFILIFFGPKSIPGIAKTLGKTIRQIKDASSEVQEEIRKSGIDIKKDLNLSGLISETKEEIQRPLDQYVSDLEEAVSYTPPSKQPISTQLPPEQDNLEVTNEEPHFNDKNELVILPLDQVKKEENTNQNV